ncbi:Por secretion system C-terminal sorting domain-containing protein [Mariniphaga anaerophila]|uniref:Por secretion system C-terminal sorting domain-containing protein n=1 Tax=Mariniphaga anaerophila TaxID=1484053 RepID=A0A1M5E316_9BACT|nr:T9SS type A sorting domain-containing protein [Mariniphaga anaerophila]SHF73639.1 Por secretion system C-terminal sorting domain-containing protein [Mariniphaga anaerophila]
MRNRIKHILSVFFVLPLVFNLYGQDAIFVGSTEEDIANSIVQYENSFYILGTSRKNSKSATDYFVIVLDENGRLVKEYLFGGVHGDIGKDIIVDESGIYLLGKTWDGGYPNNDMFLHKLDFDLNLKWSKFYGGQNNDLGHKFITTKNNGFAMIGFSTGVDLTGDVYFVIADKQGELLWENHMGDKYVDHGFDVIENELGEFIIAGTMGGFYNPTSTDYHNPDADIYIIKTDAEGQVIWKKTYGGEKHDWAKSIIHAPGGGYYICGSTQSEGAGNFDMFLMKIDDDGNQLWFKTFGGNNFEYGESVQLSTDNTLFLLGTSASYSDNKKPDHFLVKTDLDGEVIWENTYGGEGSDYSSSMVCTDDSGCVFTGWTDKGAYGRKDIVLYKITKEGDAKTFSENIPLDRETLVYVYPNPARQTINVEVTSDNNNPLSFSLFDPLGRVVMQKQIEANEKNTIQVRKESGLYFYKIVENSGIVHAGKIVIQN